MVRASFFSLLVWRFLLHLLPYHDSFDVLRFLWALLLLVLRNKQRRYYREVIMKNPDSSVFSLFLTVTFVARDCSLQLLL